MKHCGLAGTCGSHGEPKRKFILESRVRIEKDRKTMTTRITRKQIVLACALAFATSNVEAAALGGSVQGAARPIAGATVTLYAAGTGAPTQLAQARTDDRGAFKLTYGKASAGSVLYLIARGGTPKAAADKRPNDAIALLAVLGGTPPKSVVVNEFSTVASVWTSAQFLKREALSGTKLGLRIAAGNVPNLVDLETGGLGTVIQDPLNSSQTATLATFNTLANLLAGCITRVHADACDRLFAVATPPAGVTPTDTLAAAQDIARNPSHQAQSLFTLLDAFYPVPAGKRWRTAPFIPYLSFAPSAWTLSLVYAGGGMNSAGGIAFDSEGNLWAGDNFLVGAQSTIYRDFGGGVSKLAPNGRPLSPMTLGYRGGGLDGPGFGLAISADGKVWVTSLGGKTISVLDLDTGRPLSPETGYNFGGQLGSMQGIIVTPNGDIWALDNDRNQIVYLPKGDATKGRILGRTVNGKPVDGTLQVKGPFHLAVDQQDRIWVTNSGSDTVTRFPASDPGKAEQIKVGFGPRAVAIDSLGNAWVANTVGHPDTREKLAFIEEKLKSKAEGLFESSASKTDAQVKMWIDLYDLMIKYPGGDVSMVRPDGTVLPPFDGGKSIIAPWGVAVDGNDNVWVANSMGRSVTQLCGARPDNCPPGKKTGDPISPAGGYIGGLQIITDVAVDPAGNVWVANNWDRPDEGMKEVPEPALSTRFGANGTVVFFGLAKPVGTPLIGPPRAP
jgi:streptogramin lyase